MQDSRWVRISPSLTACSQHNGRVAISSLREDCLRLDEPNHDIQACSDELWLAVAGRKDVRISGQFVRNEQGHWLFKVDDNDPGFSDVKHALRKEQHIHLCRDEDVEHTALSSGLGEIRLEPRAIPELDIEDIDTGAEIFGRRFSLPLLVTGMTGGISHARQINHRLAQAACKYGIPMGVGSQRLALDNPDHAAIFQLKQTYPELFLIANIGIGQLQDEDYFRKAEKAVTMIGADALAVHVNVVQELVQVEGDRRFAATYRHLERLCQGLAVPVYVKEVGCGIDSRTARRLADIGVKAIDVGGAGGTSWTKIEGMRAADPLTQRLAATFANFGIPTAEGIRTLVSSRLSCKIIATGGLRSGLDVAKSLALGADFCGIGLPLFRAALDSDEAVCEELRFFAEGLRIAMLATGSKSTGQLKLSLMREDDTLGR